MQKSLFHSLIATVHRLPRWTAITIGALFIATPFAVAFLAGGLADIVRSGQWRALLEPAAICVYAVAVAPFMIRSQRTIVESLWPVVQLTAGEYETLVARSSQIRPRTELTVIALGVAGGFIVSRPEQLLASPSPLSIYAHALVLVQFGIMFWWIFIAFANSRVTTALLRQLWSRPSRQSRDMRLC